MGKTPSGRILWRSLWEQTFSRVEELFLTPMVDRSLLRLRLDTWKPPAHELECHFRMCAPTGASRALMLHHLRQALVSVHEVCEPMLFLEQLTPSGMVCGLKAQVAPNTHLLKAQEAVWRSVHACLITQGWQWANANEHIAHLEPIILQEGA